MTSTRFSKMILLLTCFVLLGSLGCGSPSEMFTPKISPHPDAPVYIEKTFVGWAKGSVWDKGRNELVPCGWFWLDHFKGWTFYKADWSKVQERMQAAATQPAK